ncbi:HAD family hydrolase [Roseibium sp. SCP14]|uniref:HAD family hydrolase n=1 Tax=Roseibium sp. SCP14 TaxID=3141375 RepID=UPI00333697EA
MTMTPGTIAALRSTAGQDNGMLTARVHAPVLRLDRHEPWRPTAIGFSIFDEPSRSPSSKFEIVPKSHRVIEYAIFWDYDIQHLYDLEHVWIHVDANDRVEHVEASQHGRRIEMVREGGLPLENGRVTLWAEPGKHALFPGRDQMMSRESATRHECNLGAGHTGVHLGNPFSGRFGEIGAYEHRLARLQMRRFAFQPAFGETQRWDCREGDLLPWPSVERWIPERVNYLIDDLKQNLPHLKAIFLDCGDTLVDEGTEEKEPGTDVAVRAELLPYAREMMDNLRKDGYRLALVADGPRATFENLLGQHRLWDHFESHTISGDVGVLKPDARMFATAMNSLCLESADSGRIVMVGNNLERDIKGANSAGHISVFFKWSDRRPVIPIDESEEPDVTIYSLKDLVPAIEKIELSLV